MNNNKSFMYSIGLNYHLSQMVKALQSLIPAQHTAYWYNARKGRVGASEIAVFIGVLDKSFANINSKLREKVFAPANASRYIGIAAAWGTLLEDAIRIYCETKYNTIIHETGAIPNLPGQAMSPDGLSVIGDEIVLWEFKAPSQRTIVPGKIPAYYVPQVLTGLETFPFCDYANFVEVNIKRCAIGESGGSYVIDHKFPISTRMNKKYITYPLTWGALSFMSKTKDVDMTAFGAESYMYLLEQTKNKFIDFGSCDYVTLDKFFDAYCNKFIDVLYMYQQFPDDSIARQVDEYSADELIKYANEELNGRQLIGIMRWKMVDVNIQRVDRRPGYLLATNKYAQIVNDCVKKCDKMDNNHSKELYIQDTVKYIKRLLANDKSVLVTEDYVI
jgi:hypothetical protein